VAVGLIKRNKPGKMSLRKAQFKALMNPQFASQLLFGIYVRLPWGSVGRLGLSTERTCYNPKKRGSA